MLLLFVIVIIYHCVYYNNNNNYYYCYCYNHINLFPCKLISSHSHLLPMSLSCTIVAFKNLVMQLFCVPLLHSVIRIKQLVMSSLSRENFKLLCQINSRVTLTMKFLIILSVNHFLNSLLTTQITQKRCISRWGLLQNKIETFLFWILVR